MSNTASNAEGSAYGRTKGQPNTLLTEVGPGTPCGELLRRYWHPIATSAGLTSERPREVRIMGEDLVLFRDKAGKAGLLYSRCAHRGTNLYFGKVEERGLRCCYHGWLFDVQGNCIDQPCEVDGGRNRQNFRQPWYPVEERYGLIFAYMGPLSKKPVLPRYDILEGADDYEVAVGGWGCSNDDSIDSVPCSWMQMIDNTMDPFHVFILHSTLTGIQFAPEFARMPKIAFKNTDIGLAHVSSRRMDDGRIYERNVAVIFPNMVCVPPITLQAGYATSVTWIVPVDDTNYIHVLCAKKSERREFPNIKDVNTGRSWGEMTPQERRDFPRDYEALVGQGRLSLHSEEHLAGSDQGVVMQRRLFARQIEIVAKGEDPLNVGFNADEDLVKVGACNAYVPAEAAE